MACRKAYNANKSPEIQILKALKRQLSLVFEFERHQNIFIFILAL